MASSSQANQDSYSVIVLAAIEKKAPGPETRMITHERPQMNPCNMTPGPRPPTKKRNYADIWAVFHIPWAWTLSKQDLCSHYISSRRRDNRVIRKRMERER